MRLKNLRMQNFLSHKDSHIDFDNVANISMIVGTIDGDLRRSNGSGKSTIIEAILYALFETTRFTDNKNATLDDMVRWGSDGKMLVEFQFELNNNLYRIIRTRDLNKQKSTVTFEVFSDSKWKSLTEAKKVVTNKEIIKVIGIDYSTFCASICFQQKEVDSFVSATETERKAIIKNILQLDKYDEYRNASKAKVQLIETKLENIDKQLGMFNLNALDLDLKKKELQEADKRVEAYTAQKQAIESQIEKLRKHQILFNEQIEKRNSLLAQLKEKQASTVRLSSQVVLSTAKQDDYSKIYQGKKEDYDKLQSKYESIKDQFTIEKQEILRTGKAADATLKASEKEFESVSEEYHKVNGEVERLERDIKSIKKLEAARCPTCYHQISEESKASSLEFLTAHKKILNQKASEASNSHNNAKKQVENSKKALEEVKERLQEYSKWVKEKLHLQDTMKLLKESATEAKMIIEDQKSSIKENQQIVDQYTKDVGKLQQEISEIDVDTVKFDELNKKISEKNGNLSDNNRLLTDSQVQKGRLFAEVRQYEDGLEKIKRHKEERDILSKDKFYYEELVKVFGKEIPTLIIENACFELGEEANKILRTVSGDSLDFVTQRTNKDGTLKEVFEIEITRPGISHPILIDALSNGQKFRVVFAIRIALSRLLVRRRSSTSMEFLFYDECFGSLDEQGIDDVIDVFRYLKEEFAHQLIITHGTNLKDRFGNNIIVVSQNNQGISKVAI